jgi:hypothetical protein
MCIPFDFAGFHFTAYGHGVCGPLHELADKFKLHGWGSSGSGGLITVHRKDGTIETYPGESWSNYLYRCDKDNPVTDEDGTRFLKEARELLPNAALILSKVTPPVERAPGETILWG